MKRDMKCGVFLVYNARNLAGQAFCWKLGNRLLHTGGSAACVICQTKRALWPYISIACYANACGRDSSTQSSPHLISHIHCDHVCQHSAHQRDPRCLRQPQINDHMYAWTNISPHVTMLTSTCSERKTAARRLNRRTPKTL